MNRLVETIACPLHQRRYPPLKMILLAFPFRELSCLYVVGAHNCDLACLFPLSIRLGTQAQDLQGHYQIGQRL